MARRRCSRPGRRSWPVKSVWLEVRDGAAEPLRAELDRWTACVAADRSFVDAVADRPVDPSTSFPDHDEALRRHRLATAVARSATSGVSENVP